MVSPDVIPDDFPAWMRPRQRVAQWGVLVAGLLGFIVAWGFFVRTGIPAVTLGTHTAFMTADFASALREGVNVPLWSPHALSGYGAPIPQFTPQGAAYLGALIEVFFTDDTSEALRVLMAGSLALAGIGIYGLVTAWGGRWGLVAVALYLLNPFIGLTVPHVLVDPALMLAHALMPCVLWCATRLAQGERRRMVVIGVLLLGLFVFIHPQLAVVTWGMGAALLWTTGGREVILHWLGIGTGAIGVSAPLWLPAFLLMSQVTWLEAAQMTALNGSVGEWLMPLRTPPTTPQFTMGVILPLMFVGAWLYWIRAADVRWKLLPVGTLGFGAAVLGSVLSPAVWWLSAASFGVVIGAAGLLPLLDFISSASLRQRRFVTVGAVLAIFILSFPVLSAPIGATTSDFSRAAQVRYEQRTGHTALLPIGHAIPSPFNRVPPENPILLGSYETDTLNRIPITDGARVAVMQIGSQTNVWQVGVVEEATLLISIAYFPGWEASLDGQPVSLQRHAESGLIEVVLPRTNNGTLRVAYGMTTPHLIAWLAVGCTALVLGLYTRKR